MGTVQSKLCFRTDKLIVKFSFYFRLLSVKPTHDCVSITDKPWEVTVDCKEYKTSGLCHLTSLYTKSEITKAIQPNVRRKAH
jgi:hypothetical protein